MLLLVPLAGTLRRPVPGAAERSRIPTPGLGSPPMMSMCDVVILSPPGPRIPLAGSRLKSRRTLDFTPAGAFTLRDDHTLGDGRPTAENALDEIERTLPRAPRARLLRLPASLPFANFITSFAGPFCERCACHQAASSLLSHSPGSWNR